MMITTAHELAESGVYNQSSPRLIFRNKIFTRGQSFSYKARQVAVAICQEHLDRGGFCMLVEDGNLITLWRQIGSIQPK